MNIAGNDVTPFGQDMLALVQERPDDANLWMNLATVMFCLEKKEMGLTMQAQALSLSRNYQVGS